MTLPLPSLEQVEQLEPAEARALVVRLATVLAAVHLRAVPAPVPPRAPPGDDDDDLLTDAQVAHLLAVPASAVADLRRAGALPGVPVGRKYIRTRRRDVRTYVTGLPYVTYSRRHDRRAGTGAPRPPRLDAATTR